MADRVPTPPARSLQRRFYAVCRWACAFVQWQCVRLIVADRPLVLPRGGYQLAVTHLSHLEPVVVGLVAKRFVRWMSRIEFYDRPLLGWFLRGGGAFSVDRDGVPVRAIRTAIDEVQRGGVVGIFPEGGVKVGMASAIRGGRIKRGVCVIALRSGKPIVPVVVLGTDKLMRVRAWLPFRRSRVWLAFGDPIQPPAPSPPGFARRAARETLATQLESAYQATYRRLLTAFDLDDADIP